MSNLTEDQTYAVAQRGLSVLPWISPYTEDSTTPERAAAELQAREDGKSYDRERFTWSLSGRALWAIGTLNSRSVQEAMIRLAFKDPASADVSSAPVGEELRGLVVGTIGVEELSARTCAAVVLQVLYAGAGPGVGKLLAHLGSAAPKIPAAVAVRQ